MMLDDAVSYALDGYSVFPCKQKMPIVQNGWKDATTDATKILKWWTESPDAQIGMPTGAINHLVVLDPDGDEAGQFVRGLHLPPTRTILTRPGRYHLWFRQPDGFKTKCSASVLAPKLDVRGDGGYVIVPPSIHHETGQPYHVVRDLAIALAPDSLLRLVEATRTTETIPASTSPSGIPQGSRRPTLFKIACKMRAEGLSPEAILESIRHIPCSPALPESELRKIALGTLRYDGRWSTDRAPARESTAEIELSYYHHIAREQVRWLWPQRIPRGKLTLFVGNPGTGKSLATIDLAARVSTAHVFPDGQPCELGDVLILTAEDDASDTVGPRLDAAGADSSHIARINAIKVILADGATGESTFSLERDLMKLEEALKKHPQFKLIIIDPLSAYLGTKVNSWRDAEVRALLTPLTEFATRTGIAIVGILHMRKAETDAMLRVSGSIAFVAAARAVWGFGPDPAAATSSIMVPVKNNLAPLGNALGYQITADGNGAPYLIWQKEPRTVDAEDVLGGNKKEKRERAEKLMEAKEWLRAKLSLGPVAEEQLSAAAEKLGIAWRTLRRAKGSLAVKSHKAGMVGAWYWELPEAGQQGGQNEPSI
jgi:putative DNA primase/helicase